MSKIRCHRCGIQLAEGALKYQVVLRIRSLFDGVLPETDSVEDEYEIDRLLAEMSQYSEEELTRQVYQNDIFILCPACKEVFLDHLYTDIRADGAVEQGRAHLLH